MNPAQVVDVILTELLQDKRLLTQATLSSQHEELHNALPRLITQDRLLHVVNGFILPQPRGLAIASPSSRARIIAWTDGSQPAMAALHRAGEKTSWQMPKLATNCGLTTLGARIAILYRATFLSGCHTTSFDTQTGLPTRTRFTFDIRQPVDTLINRVEAASAEHSSNERSSPDTSQTQFSLQLAVENLTRLKNLIEHGISKPGTVAPRSLELLATELPAIDGLRINAADVHSRSFATTYAEYKRRLLKRWRTLNRGHIVQLIAAVDITLEDINDLPGARDGGSKTIKGATWNRLGKFIHDLTIALGDGEVFHRSDFGRHFSFGMSADFLSIRDHDWPAIRRTLRGLDYNETVQARPKDAYSGANVVTRQDIQHIVTMLEQDPRPWQALTTSEEIATVYFEAKNPHALSEPPQEITELANEVAKLGFTTDTKLYFKLSADTLADIVLTIGLGATGFVLLNSALKAATEIPARWRKLRELLSRYPRAQISPVLELDTIHRWLDDIYGESNWQLNHDLVHVKPMMNACIFEFCELRRNVAHKILIVDHELVVLPYAAGQPGLENKRPQLASAQTTLQPKKHTILFLAANPAGTSSLALDKEARAIQVELERSGYRDQFAFETRWAVEPLDLLRELRKLRPAIVHYSGHGGAHGIFLNAIDGDVRVVSAAALAAAFEAAGSSVKLIVLNACYSDDHANALLKHVDCVVGMDGSIEDDAARSFAIGFYGGLGEGESVAAACRQGVAAIGLEGMNASNSPRLRVGNGVDANRIILAGHNR